MFRFLSAILLFIVSAHSPASDSGFPFVAGQPGSYGQINLGNHYPPPRLIYPDPTVAIPSPAAVPQQPVYLHVPPGHAKKWSKHCHRYNACQQPVYFVREDWYNDVYAPQQASQHRHSSHDQMHDGYRESGDDDYEHHRGQSSHRHKQRQGDDDRFDDDHDDEHREKGKSRQRNRGDHGDRHDKQDRDRDRERERGNRRD